MQESSSDVVDLEIIKVRDGKKDGKRKAEERPKISSLDLIREQEERRKEMRNRKDFWLHKNIVVKITTKRLGPAYHKKKGVVIELIDDYTGMVELGGGGEAVKLDQTHLETVIPALGKPVLVVNGAYRGTRGTLEALDPKSFSVSVKLESGPAHGRLITGVKYEDVSKLALPS